MPMEQTLILVDDKDNILGYAPRNGCHTGNGKQHRAFVILLYNKDKKILLQHRKHKLFDRLWDLAGASHPLRISGRNESYIKAASRCLEDEWSILDVKLEKIGSFIYFREEKKNCENEYCTLIVGKYDGKIVLNPEVAYDFRWVNLRQLLTEIDENPKIFTPWLMESVKIFRNNKLGKEFLKL